MRQAVEWRFTTQPKMLLMNRENVLNLTVLLANPVACPIFCTSEIVTVAQLSS